MEVESVYEVVVVATSNVSVLYKSHSLFDPPLHLLLSLLSTLKYGDVFKSSCLYIFLAYFLVVAYLLMSLLSFLAWMTIMFNCDYVLHGCTICFDYIV